MRNLFHAELIVMASLGYSKIFVASPNDVIEERNALAKLFDDINDILVYLAREEQLRLELIRY